MRVLLLLLLGSVWVAANDDGPMMSAAEHEEVFAAWKQAHGKQYTSEKEEGTRFANFKKHVAEFHKKHELKTRLPNSLADMAKPEFEACLRGCSLSQEGVSLPAPPAGSEYALTQEDLVGAPWSLDWRTKGVVTRVKNQGSCGSCWTFSATGAMESAWAMAGNSLIELSEQELLSCDWDGNYGCSGGWPYKAMDFVRDYGEATEQSYPYVSGGGSNPSCEMSWHARSEVKVTGYYNVAQTEDAMAAALAKYGPLSITVSAMTNLWWPYTGGIMSGCYDTSPDHAVLLVGYGEENGWPYWLIKNSWGASWGEDGYLRLERGTNQCGITTNPAVLALVESRAPPATPTPTSPRTPTPTSPPTPSTASCPAECVESWSNGMKTCTWQNNTNGVILPPPSTLATGCSNYKYYGSFYYIWDGAAASPSAYPCPPTAYYRTWNGQPYCMFFKGYKGLDIPSGATVDCSELISSGFFSISFAAAAPPRTPMPTPVPTPMPTPAPVKPSTEACPAECVESRRNGMTTCTWQNNTNGVVLPPPSTLDSVCSNYANYESFYYMWDSAEASPSAYKCPPTAYYTTLRAGQAFCMFFNGAHGLDIPPGATVDCSNLLSGTLSYTYY